MMDDRTSYVHPSVGHTEPRALHDRRASNSPAIGRQVFEVRLYRRPAVRIVHRVRRRRVPQPRTRFTALYVAQIHAYIGEVEIYIKKTATRADVVCNAQFYTKRNGDNSHGTERGRISDGG